MAAEMAAPLHVKLAAAERGDTPVPVERVLFPMVYLTMEQAAAVVEAAQAPAPDSRPVVAVVLEFMDKGPAERVGAAALAAAAAVAVAVLARLVVITVVRAAQPIFMAETAGLMVEAAQ
jgi:hypothetical protein